jgi:hypothetical protein
MVVVPSREVVNAKVGKEKGEVDTGSGKTVVRTTLVINAQLIAASRSGRRQPSPIVSDASSIAV